jgi:hypothetical protein
MSDKSSPMLSTVYQVFAIPYNFVIGFLVGVMAPVAAIAAIVAGVRFLTGKMPFLRQAGDGEERSLAIELVAPEQVGELFQAEKQRVTDELGDLQAEIKTIIEEAQAQAQAQAQGQASAEA